MANPRFDRSPPERNPTRINERIRVSEVRLIDEEGNQVGIVPTDQALALGWGGRATRDTWRVEYAEDEHWPHWLALRFNGSKGPQHYIVHFATREGRWIIQDWLVPTKAPGTPAGRARSK